MSEREPGAFDHFAGAASTFTGRAPFFAGCVLLILVWAPSYPIWGNGDTWQLVINTTTTIVTFLLVALLQNAQARFEKATNAKLNALAEAQALQLDAMPASARCSRGQLRQASAELRRAHGLEDEVGA